MQTQKKVGWLVVCKTNLSQHPIPLESVFLKSNSLTGTYTKPDTLVVLVAAKADAADPTHGRRAVSAAEGEELARSFGLKFIETSAKNAHNVEKAFALLAADLKARAPSLRSEVNNFE